MDVDKASEVSFAMPCHCAVPKKASFLFLKFPLIFLALECDSFYAFLWSLRLLRWWRSSHFLLHSGMLLTFWRGRNCRTSPSHPDSLRNKFRKLPILKLPWRLACCSHVCYSCTGTPRTQGITSTASCTTLEPICFMNLYRPRIGACCCSFIASFQTAISFYLRKG